MLDFYVVSSLKSFGYTEDGEEFIGEIYYVVAEDKDGNRWEHDHVFSGVAVGYDDEHGVSWFDDTRIPAEAAALELMERIKATGITSVDGRPHWSLGRPSYGSKAYQDYGQYNDWLEDKQAA